MVATKQNSIQMHEDSMQGEDLSVAGVCCVCQDGGVGDKTGMVG